jgi:ribose transport system substrate-binding protein
MSEQSARETKYHFVIVPKLTFEAPFFFSVGLGCQGYVKQELLGIAECHYRGYAEADAVEQARVIRELITDPSLHGLDRIPDGISIAVLDEEITGAAIDFVYEAGVPVITFDSDAPTSKGQAFVSTDNYAFGLELGKVLDQLNPNGGNFGMITANGPNLLGRLNGVRDRLFNDPLHPTRWTEVDYSPLNCENNVTLANELMHQYAADPNIQAIIPVGGWPMFNPVLWKEFVEANRNVFTVVADSVDVQIKLM